MLEQIASVFAECFDEYVKLGSFIALGRLYPEELLLSVGYLRKQALRQDNIELSISYDVNKDNMLQTIHLCVDCLSSLMGPFLKGEKAEFPRQWQNYEYEKRTVFLKYSTTNTKLEEMANQLLKGDKEFDDPSPLAGESATEELIEAEDDTIEELKSRIAYLRLNEEQL